MTFLAAQAGGHPPGCPHRAGLILSKKEKNSTIFTEIFELRERFLVFGIRFQSGTKECIV